MEQPENPIDALRSYITNPPVGSKFVSKQTPVAAAPGATKSIPSSSDIEPTLNSVPPVTQIADEEPFEVGSGIPVHLAHFLCHHA